MNKKEQIELVSEHCPEDCYYRSYIDGGNTPICFYAVIEGVSRKCKVSECDKYRSSKMLRPRLQKEYVLTWEYELYDDEDADIVWKTY